MVMSSYDEFLPNIPNEFSRRQVSNPTSIGYSCNSTLLIYGSDYYNKAFLFLKKLCKWVWVGESSEIPDKLSEKLQYLAVEQSSVD